MNNLTILPTHIGIIMDGNRRWANKEGLPTLKGHQEGLKTMVTIAEHVFSRGAKYLSIYAFSAENWNRSESEVKYLMDLVPFAFKKYLKKLDEQNIRLLFMGSSTGVKKSIVELCESAEKQTANNSGGTLCVCFNYGGRQEIIEACNKYAEEAQKENHVLHLDEFSKYLYHPEVPDIDLLIRTSGEKRVSNFMLWRIAYSELYFTDKLWPDFKASDIEQAIKEYNRRQRRYGV